MQVEDEKCEIRVQSYIWKSGLMYLTGHYEFEIVIKKLKVNVLSSKTVYRRFSDLEILHEGLIKFNPGCRVPPLPEKSFWCNLYINNDSSLEKRKKNIEEYLGYIYNHPYISMNPIFMIFLSDDFERYKTEYNKKSTIIDKLYSLKQYFPNIFKFKIPKGDYKDHNDLNIERENLWRLDRGLSDIIVTLQNLIKINEDRTDSLKNILNVTKSLEHTSLKIEEPQIDEEYKAMKKGMESNIEIFFGLFEKNREFLKMLCLILEDLKKYSVEIIGLKDIYERIDNLSNNLKKLKLISDEIMPNKNIEVAELDDIISNADHHLYFEISNFKKFREKDLLSYVQKLFIQSNNYEIDLSSVLESKLDFLKSDFNVKECKNLENKENHFV